MFDTVDVNYREDRVDVMGSSLKKSKSFVGRTIGHYIIVQETMT